MRSQHRGKVEHPELFPGALRRRVVFQIIFLVLVLGMLGTLARNFDRTPTSETELSGDLPPHLPAVGSGEALGDADLGIENIDAVEVQRPTEPLPFTEKPELWERASVAEAEARVDAELVTHVVHRVRKPPDGAPEVPRYSERAGDHVWSKLIAEPGSHRGALVEIVGNILQPTGRAIFDVESSIVPPRDHPAGVSSLYRGYVFGNESKYYVLLDWKRPEVELSHMDGVVARGRFVQLFKYDVEYQGSTIRAVVPLLVLESLELLPALAGRASAHSMRPLYIVMIGAGLILGAFVLIVSWRSDRRFAEWRAARRSKRTSREAGSPD
jgi:hypothetical protein